MKNLKTFVINKFQVSQLRSLLIANGETAEAEKFSGADLAFRWKACNLEVIGSKAQKEAFAKQYPYFVGYDLISEPEQATDTSFEMSTPEVTSEAVQHA